MLKRDVTYRNTVLSRLAGAEKAQIQRILRREILNPFFKRLKKDPAQAESIMIDILLKSRAGPKITRARQKYGKKNINLFAKKYTKELKILKNRLKK